MTATAESIQTATTLHRRRCIAAMLYERTKAGKRTTVRELAAAYGWNPRSINPIVRLMVDDPTETNYGLVVVKPAGQRTNTGGVTAATYCAVLHHKNENQ
jgi:hypothetical protein